MANRLCQRFSSGSKTSWHGHALEVRTVFGRGGKSGKQYQVKISSLPQHLQDRLKALQITDEAVSKLRFGDAAQLERNWKFDIISRALDYPKGSGERKAEIDRQHGRTVHDWTGCPMILARSTIYKWIENFELYGVHGLTSKIRRDKGERKVFISRAWSDAVPFDDETKASIQTDLKQYVRSLIKGGSQFKQTCILTAWKLREISAAYGFEVADPVHAEIVFAIPQAFVKEERQYKAVYRHKFDRKASEDDRPRIRRTTANLVPMEVVVMDVHHINVHVGRDDGSYSTPKLIAAHDIATGRVFCEIIQFDNRGGVRNTDNITAVANMFQHPAFGVAQFIYVDNGSEYGFADDLEDALKLGSKVIGFNGSQERNRIIRSIAYNASAKHVEGWFRQMNQQYFRHIQGWRDDDPMNPKRPKRPKLGKLHAPYPHGFDTFCDEVYGYLNAYEQMPQQGGLGGKSPALTFKKHVEAGWSATLLDPNQLLTVFTRPETRVVKKHGIEVRGAAWTCDGLLTFFGRTVIVHIPKYHGFAELLITDEHGAEIGIAVADRAFDVLDERGAKESARRVSIRSKALTNLGKTVPDINVGAELIAFGQNQLPVVPNEPNGTISVNRPGSQRRARLPIAAESMSHIKQDEELRRANEERSAIFERMRLPGKGK